MKLKILKLIVLFLKWFSQFFKEDIEIYLSKDNSKKVTLKNESYKIFLGDYLGFYKCENVHYCRLYHFDCEYEKWEGCYHLCDNMSYCVVVPINYNLKGDK